MCAGACFCDRCCTRARAAAFAYHRLDRYVTREGEWLKVYNGRETLLQGRGRRVLRSGE